MPPRDENVTAVPPAPASDGESPPSSPGLEAAAAAAVVPADQNEAGRERWSSHWAMLLACIGNAIGLGNIIRFPSVVKDNGGGVFMLVYVLAVLMIGIPVLLLELSLGQRFQTGVVDAFKRIRPALRGVGWVMVAGSFLIVSYYNVLMAWAIRYLWSSFESPLPWADDSGDYFLKDVLETPHTDDGFQTINETSGMAWYNVLAMTAAWVMTLGAVHSGIKSSGKVVWLTVPLPFLLVVLLMIRGLTLEGAGAGIEYYLKPDMSRFFEARVWTAAFSQIFFSLSVATGSMSAFASFNPRNNNVWRDTLIVGFSNSLFSIIAGFAVFSVLGHLAWKQGVELDDLSTGGLGLAFIAFPAALAELPAAQFFSVCFFLMLLTLGIDSAFALTEAVITVLRDFLSEKHHARIPYYVCAAGWLSSLAYVTDGGLFLLNVVDHFVSTYLLMPVGLAECLAVAWVYGAKRFADEMQADTGVKMGRVWEYVWKYVTPGMLAVALVIALYDDLSNPVKDPFDNDNQTWSMVLGFIVGIGPIVLAIAYGVYAELGGDRELQGDVEAGAAGHGGVTNKKATSSNADLQELAIVG